MAHKMDYSAFKEKSARVDKLGNDNNHFFSSLFSNRIAYVLYIARFSPNLVTLVFLLVGLFASGFVYLGNPIMAYVCWRLHIILDMADGDIARATKVFSPLANGFDKSNHIIINTFLIYTIANDTQIFFSALIFYIVFQLYYNFDRNFDVKIVGNKIQLSISKVILKNLMTIEGYVFTTLLVNLLDFDLQQMIINIFYSCSMSLLFFYKLRLGFK